MARKQAQEKAISDFDVPEENEEDLELTDVNEDVNSQTIHNLIKQRDELGVLDENYNHLFQGLIESLGETDKTNEWEIENVLDRYFPLLFALNSERESLRGDILDETLSALVDPDVED
jgi:hypothetical protein